MANNVGMARSHGDVRARMWLYRASMERVKKLPKNMGRENRKGCKRIKYKNCMDCRTAEIDRDERPMVAEVVVVVPAAATAAAVIVVVVVTKIWYFF